MAGSLASFPETVNVRVVLISLDSHLGGVVARAREALKRDLPGLTLDFHAASEWSRHPATLEAARSDIARADFVVASMLFMEEHIRPVLADLQARRDQCDAMLGCMASSEVVRLTRLGRFDMMKPASGPVALIKRLRGSGGGDRTKAGAQQMKTLKRLPKILKFVPGTAQDVRAYFLSLQYWLAGNERNIAGLVRYLIDRYASGPRAGLRGKMNPPEPQELPETGLYHPAMNPPVSERVDAIPAARDGRPSVGLLVMRSYVTAQDTGHYDGVIAALEARGLRAVPAFASGLDAREAIERYFVRDGKPTIDALVSLTGFSLVGGPAFNDSPAAVDMLKRLNVPYVCAQALEFQSLAEWASGERGLTPVETTMMVALPELDGATSPIVFGGRADAGTACAGCARACQFSGDAAGEGSRRMRVCPERAEMLAGRVAKLVALKRKARGDRKLAVTLFGFPPNGGSAGTAAHLGVFESLHATLKALKAAGYKVEVPADVDALRARVLSEPGAATEARIAALIPAGEHVKRETRLAAIEAQWGAAPGRQLSDGRNIQVLGARLGNVFIGVQPTMGTEGDPMRLLFAKDFAPTHAFSAYYRWLREDFGADAVLHFGTHGALEFMPGKQAGLSSACWSDSLIGDLPNVYFYAANNPSEATIAKRRSGAVTVSYLTPAVTQAGLYKAFADLHALIARYRSCAPEGLAERAELAMLIADGARALDFDVPQLNDADAAVEAIRAALHEIEERLIPHGLHVAGAAPTLAERVDLLGAMQQPGEALGAELLKAIARGETAMAVAKRLGQSAPSDALARLVRINAQLLDNRELAALIHALDGGYTAPVAGGDLIRDDAILPTGRNIHGFDPFRMPSVFALHDGARQALRLVERHRANTGASPRTVAIVLWGTDNLKSEGAQLAQALALMGARPRFDAYGRLCGAELIPLAELGRARVDVVVTLSGIFRDLLPLQTKMLAEAAWLAASAEGESEADNPLRAHALAYARESGCTLETAALRVFSNADGAYGANVNQLVEAGTWEDGNELAEAYTRRKCFAYGRDGQASAQGGVLDSVLKHVDLAYQNLESVETGLTTIDHYFDTLGGIGKAVERAKGVAAPVYIGDQTQGAGTVRSLSEQMALEARTRTLNPKWYEGMLRHGYEGVRQIEAHVTNTLGWSATTGEVEPWIYERMTQTFVLDEGLRERMASLNPRACAKLAGRLIEASERKFWNPDPETLAALRRAGDELDDRMEGITPSAAPVAVAAPALAKASAAA